jgi:hypothetical protein
MALSAVLEIGDNGIKRYQKQYLLSDFHIVFNRSYNVLPKGMPRCERIEMVIVAPGRKDLEMFALFLRGDSIDGRIVIGLTDEVNDNDAKVQVLYFEGARFFSMSEKYDIESNRRRLLKLSMVSESLQLENVQFKCL